MGHKLLQGSKDWASFSISDSISKNASYKLAGPTLKKVYPERTGGGGEGECQSTPSTFRANFFVIVSRVFFTFFFQVLRNFWHYFHKTRAYHSEVTQHYQIECRLKIWGFSGFLYKTYMKKGFSAKTQFWALKVFIALIIITITVMCIDNQYLNN